MQQNDINLDELAKHIIAAMFIFCSDVIIIKEIWCFGIVQKCFSKFCAMSNLLEMNFSGLMILITFGITAKIIFSTVPDLILWMFVLKKKKKNPELEYLCEIWNLVRGVYVLFLIWFADVSFEIFLYHRIASAAVFRKKSYRCDILQYIAYNNYSTLRIYNWICYSIPRRYIRETGIMGEKVRT